MSKVFEVYENFESSRKKVVVEIVKEMERYGIKLSDFEYNEELCFIETVSILDNTIYMREAMYDNLPTGKIEKSVILEYDEIIGYFIDRGVHSKFYIDKNEGILHVFSIFPTNTEIDMYYLEWQIINLSIE